MRGSEYPRTSIVQHLYGALRDATSSFGFALDSKENFHTWNRDNPARRSAETIRSSTLYRVRTRFSLATAERIDRRDTHGHVVEKLGKTVWDRGRRRYEACTRSARSSSSARVTLPQYALIDPIGGLAVGIPRIHEMPDAPVEALTSVSKVLLSFLRGLVTLALSSHVTQSPTEMSYHLLYAVMMMMLLLLLLLVFVGRTGRAR